MLASTSLADDGRPFVEVESATLVRGELLLVGTAVVFEGTILVEFHDEQGLASISSYQASAGGPERGNWQARAMLARGTARVIVRGSDMKEGQLLDRTDRDVAIEVSDLERYGTVRSQAFQHKDTVGSGGIEPPTDGL